MSATVATSPDDVFINCPFDSQYAPIFRALIFVVFACSFRVRCALEIEDGSEVRLEKIYSLVEQSRFGIHDLSRTQLDANSQLPRFNMPFELGVFLGAKRFGSADQKRKRALVLDIEQFRYQSFISDLAGADIRAHHGEVADAVGATRNWLASVSKRALPSANALNGLYIQFLEDLPLILASLEFDDADLPYGDYERIVTQWLLEKAN